MKRFLMNVAKVFEKFGRKPSPARPGRSVRLQVEAMEDRFVPSLLRLTGLPSVLAAARAVTLPPSAQPTVAVAALLSTRIKEVLAPHLFGMRPNLQGDQFWLSAGGATWTATLSIDTENLNPRSPHRGEFSGSYYDFATGSLVSVRGKISGLIGFSAGNTPVYAVNFQSADGSLHFAGNVSTLAYYDTMWGTLSGPHGSTYLTGSDNIIR
jgi:hypothetical protein